jgi:SNF2 family DNA or RNA helicase
MRRYYLADDEETGLPVTALRTSGWIDDLLNASEPRDHYTEVEKPANFLGELRPYQHRGLAWLSFLARHGMGSCLADDMGLGKTIQMIALWLLERADGATPGPTLLVVPMSLVGNWQRELQRFAPTLRVMVHHGMERLTGQDFQREAAGHDVIISTYGLAFRDFEHLAAVPWYRIALDEAQNIKNPAAKQSTALRSLRCVQRVALTGTPVENRLSELWSIVDFLNPGYLGSAHDFRHRFALPIERHHDENRAQRLRHLIRPFILRRRKDDPGIQLDLPEKMEMKVYCNLTREQAALYEAVVREMLTEIDQSGGMQRRGRILATLIKLKQICNHPAHFLGDGSPLAHRSGKCDRIVEMLEEVLAEGHRALVFTQFREMGTLLQKLIEDSLGGTTLFLHGGCAQKARQEMVDRFQDPRGGVSVFLLSLKAGGFGLNLTAANHVFHFDRWWNPAVEDQASSRAHRIGQEKAVQVHKFLCVGTLEERIDALMEHKRNIAENIVGTGEEWLTELSTDALRELFALSREAVSED